MPIGGQVSASAPNWTRAAILQSLRTDRDHDGFPDGTVEGSGTASFVDVDSDNRPDALVIKDDDPSASTMTVGFTNKAVPGSAGSLATQCTTIPDLAYQQITGGLFATDAKAACIGNDNQGSLSADFDDDGVKDPQFPTGPEMTANTTGLYTLMVNRVGQGTVSSNPVGIDCHDQANSVCIASFSKNNSVTLNAMPKTGWTLDKWSSDDPGTNCNQNGPGTIDLTFSTSCTATFTEGTTPTPTPTPNPTPTPGVPQNFNAVGLGGHKILLTWDVDPQDLVEEIRYHDQDITAVANLPFPGGPRIDITVAQANAGKLELFVPAQHQSFAAMHGTPPGTWIFAAFNSKGLSAPDKATTGLAPDPNPIAEMVTTQ